MAALATIAPVIDVERPMLTLRRATPGWLFILLLALAAVRRLRRREVALDAMP